MGGTTLHWEAKTLRMLPEDFQLRSKYGHGLDWPISYEQLMPYYGISIDQDNNLYVGDLATNAVRVIKSDRSYQLLTQDQKLSWTDSFSFGVDGYLYCNCNQLHRSAPLHGGENIASPPYYIFRLQPLARGVVGR